LTLVEQVASHMEELIEQEHWKVGEKIPSEKELMEKFDVSRNTLREAIRALVHSGLLQTKQGRGTIVHNNSVLGIAIEREIKKSNLLETLEVRLALEKQAAELAAERRTDTDLIEIEVCLNDCKKAAKKHDLEQFIISDISFHKTIVQASNNQLLIDLYEHMTEALSLFIHDVLTIGDAFTFEQGLHLDLLQAIKNQDTRLAATY